LLRTIEICDWRFTIYEATGYSPTQFDVAERLGLQQFSAALRMPNANQSARKLAHSKNQAAVYWSLAWT